MGYICHIFPRVNLVLMSFVSKVYTRHLNESGEKTLLRTRIKSELNSGATNAVQYVVSQQMKNGAIPWFNSAKVDPWDHSEALMALAIGGCHTEWLKGFDWLVTNQNIDGSWYASYLVDDGHQNKKVETNFVAYPASALWHFFLINRDKSILKRYFPTVKKAIDYVLSHQSNEGDIQWALYASTTQVETQNSIKLPTEKLPRDALVTACSSILRSLECAISIAETLAQECDAWKKAYASLYNALKNKPWRFDRTWESKERFSMDWFYPILAGIYNEQEANLRLDLLWDKFIEPGVGCRCVSDEPWMTVAETCEFTLALISSNRRTEATTFLNNLLKWQDEDGGFWTGYNFRDKNIWPQEKTTWTAAAFVLATDALLNLTPAANLFTESSSIVYALENNQ